MIPSPPSSRYECLVKVASGGMATVYVGRLRGKHGFSRLVAIKRAHTHLLEDEALRRGLIVEARLAAQIHDPHVVSVLDVDEPNGELMLIMDYVEGGSLSQLLTHASKRGELLAPGIVARVLLDSCAGLAAAHELRDVSGAPLSIVHRDVSPHNILVGVDGLSRIADFGIAKWVEATHATSTGLKGKFSYMAPEYIKTRTLDQRADVFALGVVAWEAFTGHRLFRGEDELATIQRVVELEPAPVSSLAPLVPPELDAPIARALQKDPADRFDSARAFAHELNAAAERAGLDLSATGVGATVRRLLGDVLETRRRALRDLSGPPTESRTPPSDTPCALVGADDTHTATATLDAAFATDARTLPIARSPTDGAQAGPEVAPRTGVMNSPRLSARATVLATLTVLAIALGALLWPRQSSVPLAQAISVGGTAVRSGASQSLVVDRVAPPSTPSSTLPHAFASSFVSATASFSTVAVSEATATPMNRPQRRFAPPPGSSSSVSAPPPPSVQPSAPGTRTRPGLGY